MDRPAQAAVMRPLEPEIAAKAPLLPDFGARCITEIVPQLLARDRSQAPGSSFVPPAVLHANQIVLLVIDGLGWGQVEAHRDALPNIASMQGSAITSVLPTTTATALTSITTGQPPAKHGVVGYRFAAPGGVLNVLKWSTPSGDARKAIPPHAVQTIEPFLGTAPPVVSRAEFENSGFSEAHLFGSPLMGWRMPSSIPVEVGRLVDAGAPFVYAYYDGIDKIAHDKGLGEHFEAELRATDRLVGDIVERLPKGCALCLTADHGQVEVLDPAIVLHDEIMEMVTALSGEGRFRWLHARTGAAVDLREACADRYGECAWVRSRDEMFEEGWFGSIPTSLVAGRFGDVALVARSPVAFFDPSDTGELRLVARHGSATADEMLVPFLSFVR